MNIQMFMKSKIMLITIKLIVHYKWDKKVTFFFFKEERKQMTNESKNNEFVSNFFFFQKQKKTYEAEKWIQVCENHNEK